MLVNESWKGIERQDPFASMQSSVVESEGGPESSQKVPGGSVIAVEFCEPYLPKRRQQWLQICSGCRLLPAKIFVLTMGRPILSEHWLTNGSLIKDLSVC